MAQPEDKEMAETAQGEESLTPEEQARRARVEHEALVAVFKSVRTASSDSRLSQPVQWEEDGLVPDHLTGEDLEMMVYDYLHAFWEREEERALEEADQEPKPTFRTATRAVGIPRAFDPVARAEDEARAAQEAADAEKEATAGWRTESDAFGESESALAAESLSVHGGDECPVDAPARGDGSFASAPHERAHEKDGQEAAAAIVRDEDDSDAFEPFELTVEGVRGVVCLVDGEPAFVPYAPGEAPEEEVDCTGIKLLQGRTSYYLYDSGRMTDAFANWAFMAEENDDASTLATLAREESRTYPRPMPASSLKNDPFGFTDDRIDEAWKVVQECGSYPDIAEAFASNGDRYFFSTDYLSRAYAESLAEWASVERYMNV